MNLVVGATGQLGTRIVEHLLMAEKPVRALVRKESVYQHLEQRRVEIAFGDLRDRSSLEAACDGVKTVLATANPTAPSQQGDTFQALDDGYRDLIDLCKLGKVEQFIFISGLFKDERVPLVASKMRTEQAIKNSGIPYTIFRAAAFMDVYFAFMGSDLPLRGNDISTVERPFKFSRNFFNRVRADMETNNKINLLGNGETRHSYICIDNVAAFMVNAIGHPEAMNKVIDIGGPEALSGLDMKERFEKVLGKPLKPSHAPPFVFNIALNLLKPFAPATANVMGLNYITATQEGVVSDPHGPAGTFGVQLTSADEFLREKATLSA